MRALGDTITDASVHQFDPVYGFPRYYSLRPYQHRRYQVIVESFAPAP